MITKELFIFLIGFFIVSNSWAYNIAQITVVEAPLFKSPEANSKVVQYLHKGDKIALHPAEILKNPYDQNINIDAELAEENIQDLSENENDPLFKHSPPYTPDRNGLYYKTSDNLGNDAWILKEHVFVLYEDTREFAQKVIKPDPTDYVLSEPLPKNYPLKNLSGYRSFVSFGLGPNTRSSYPYKSQINDIGYGFDKSLDLSWVQNFKKDERQRSFYGFQFSFQSGDSQYSFDKGKALEEYSLLTVGPRLEYDVWKNNQYRINLNTSLQLSIIDEVRVKFKSKDDALKNDNRNFSAFQILPSAGANLQREKFIHDMDLIGGFNMFFHLPNSYKTENSPSEPSWWDGDKFEVPFYANINFFIGIQSSI